ncbi:MAG: hypothetical protein FWE40_05315 [Oscillospiraceae bacterium]|jgi:hypothetical protein|nr:hypothetical protein [Oscillospiraceae bacterium]
MKTNRYKVTWKYGRSPYQGCKEMSAVEADSPKTAIAIAKDYLATHCEWDDRDFASSKFRADKINEGIVS